jgi:hypothetical protein
MLDKIRSSRENSAGIFLFCWRFAAAPHVCFFPPRSARIKKTGEHITKTASYAG